MAENGLRAALLETIAGLMSTEQVLSSAEWLKFILEREIIGSLSISKDEALYTVQFPLRLNPGREKSSRGASEGA